MNINEVASEISKSDFDLADFVQLAVDANPSIRNEIITQMMTNPDIMVYYHCYEVVSQASQEKPELFYPYWHEVASLLKHKNSYHRDIALTVIANLTRVDDHDLFAKVATEYFEHIHDKKFMTARYCIQNSRKIYANKPEFRGQIVSLLLDLDHLCAYPENQKELLRFDVLELFDAVRGLLAGTGEVDEFIRKSVSSKSPKTRAKAKELVKKYGL